MTDTSHELDKLIAEVEAGKKPVAARRTTFESAPDGTVVRKVYDAQNNLISTMSISPAQQLSLKARSKLGLSQIQFAKMLGISVRTVHDWEQGRKRPSGAARTLLKIAAINPEAIRIAMQESI